MLHPGVVGDPAPEILEKPATCDSGWCLHSALVLGPFLSSCQGTWSQDATEWKMAVAQGRGRQEQSEKLAGDLPVWFMLSYLRGAGNVLFLIIFTQQENWRERATPKLIMVRLSGLLYDIPGDSGVKRISASQRCAAKTVCFPCLEVLAASYLL
ncbi:uncharacterized protein LOC116271252 [Papio anubis]|uniref:uncharacterized protein LOC116271252 n=1 Tax=Papio anubis TaxID=9555 RepID=UPI0012AD6359|nr:uncharacterized protein LOC116271252 [Papio anubis]